MYPTVRLFTAMALASIAFETTVLAGPAGVKPPKAHVARPTPVQSVKPVRVQAPKPTGVKAVSMKAVRPVKAVAPVKAVRSVKAVAPVKPAGSIAKAGKIAKTDAKLARSTVKADAKLARSTAKADAKLARSTAKADATAATTTPAATTTEAVPGIVVISNPLADKIGRNPKLAAKIEAKLPAGVTLAQASTGFRNQGQFMAAVNVSNNLGIDFMKLQAVMTGQTTKVDPLSGAILSTPTGVAPLSLGQSIQKLRPGVDAGTAIAGAEGQTAVMVQTTSVTTSTPVVTTAPLPTTTTTPGKTKGRKNGR